MNNMCVVFDDYEAAYVASRFVFESESVICAH